MAREVMRFDKSNSQEDYQYIAKNMRGNYEVGYIFIDKPWYSNPKDWTYYIFKNKYVDGGFCGGAIDLGLEKIIVKPDTIEPYTQIAKIKYNQSIGVDTVLVKDSIGDLNDRENIVAFVRVTDEIPYELWT